MLREIIRTPRQPKAPAPAQPSKLTLLYRIPPHNAGTGEVESLFSLLQRLAYAHSMPPTKLVRITLASEPRIKASLTPTEKGERISRRIHGEGWGWGWGWDKDAGKLMIGPGDGAKAWAHALSIATGLRRLDHCTLAPLNYHVTTTHLLTAEQRVCLHCIREDEANYKLPYERLLWRLADVSCCPTHRVRLFTPLCGKERAQQCDPYARVMHPGVCSGCGSVGYRCSAAVPEPADEGEVWRAQQCAELLHAMQQTAWDRHPGLMKELVRAQATVLGVGIPGMAKRVGASESIFWDWLHKKNVYGRISLAQLIDIAGVEGISLAGLLAGKFQPVDTPAGCRTPHRVKRVIPKVDHAALKAAMRQALDDGRCAKDVAESMKVDINTLRRHPELYRKLRANTQQRLEEETRARQSAALQEAVEAATAMIERGYPVTLRNACEVSEDRWYPAELRAKCLQVLMSVLRHDAPPTVAPMGHELLTAAVEAGHKLREEAPRIAMYAQGTLFTMFREAK